MRLQIIKWLGNNYLNKDKAPYYLRVLGIQIRAFM